jgi:predicted acetyltransferase
MGKIRERAGMLYTDPSEERRKVAMAKSVMVRAPAREELERAALIGQTAFESPEPGPWARSYNWIADNWGLDHLIVVEVDGQLVASLLCTPGMAHFSNDIVPLSAVGGVSTLPEHRRCGYGGMMMAHAVRVLYDHGYHTSALWPFSYNYYRKFDWEVASEHRSYTIPSELASKLAPPDGTRPARKDELPTISRLVARFARRYNCVTVRDDLWWSCIGAISGFEFDGSDDPRTSRCPWVHERDGEIDGCAVFNVSGEGEQTKVEIKELVAGVPEARRAILSRLAALGAPDISFYGPIDDGFLQELPDPGLVKVELHSGFQFRVTNPPAALELRSADPGLSGRIGFLVTDPVLGSVEFDVEVTAGKISRAKARAGERLSMDVQTFSQLYSGYESPVRAAELGRVQATSRSVLEFANRLFGNALPFRSLVEIG